MSSDAESDLDNAELQPLRPAPKGSRWCLCAGEVLFMAGHYGWLTTDSIIEHPSAGKNGGRIYVHQRDVASSVTLVEGDKVVFYLYVDDQGLGAEECRLQAWEENPCVAAQPAPPSMNPNAAVFVPGTAPAVQFTPAPSFSGWARPPASAPVQAFGPTLNAFALNEAYWSDFSDDSSDSEVELVAAAKAEGDDDGDVESNGENSDSEGEKRGARWDLRTIPRRVATRRTRRKAKTHSSGSSSTSVPSDSDGAAPLPPPPGLRHPSFRPPPGLSLA